VRVGAAAASLGALLALIAGIGRTTLAMAREDDLPRVLAAVHPRWRVPQRAEIAAGAIVVVTVAFVDLRGAIGFSSFGVLIYYFIANAAAFRQTADARLYPRALQVLGAVGCTLLVVTLPVIAVAVGALVVAAGIIYRLVRLRLLRARPS
jgi:APA family basic amino acid/polyamine antiporter